MVACLDRAAHERPTCVLLEDVHWFDPRSWSLVSLVSQRVPRLQLSLTLRPRPQPVHDDERLLQERADCATMHVGPLSKDDIGVLACRRIGASTLSESVRAVLDARCGGHPLTAEELASSLVETGAVEIDGSGVRMLAEDVDVRRLAIPKTTQGLLTSRIDHLPPQAQLVLKVASVIGTVVNPRLLHDIHPVPEACRGWARCSRCSARPTSWWRRRPAARRSTRSTTC